MKRSGEFLYTIDLNSLGAHTGVVSWRGYRAPANKEDDYDAMTIESVCLDICGTIVDIRKLVPDPMLSDMKISAWERFAAADGAGPAHSDIPTGIFVVAPAPGYSRETTGL